MQKALTKLCVLLAVVCGTFVFATNSKNGLALFERSGANNRDMKSNALTGSQSDKRQKPSFVNTFSIDEVNRVTSHYPMESEAASKHARSLVSAKKSSESKEFKVIDLWNDAPLIKPLNAGGAFDKETNTISFPGREEATYQIFTGMDEWESDYNWFAMLNTTYVFRGTLKSESEVKIYPTIGYYNNSTDKNYVKAQVAITLNQDNNYTCDFEVNAKDIAEGSPVLVTFFVDGTSKSTSAEGETEASFQTIVSTNNTFYSITEANRAEKWSSENAMTGLGLDSLNNTNCYTVLCDDGKTTLGLFQDPYSNSVNITGINTEADTVSIPNMILIDENLYPIKSLGYEGRMNWSAANNLKVLDLNSIQYVSTPSLSPTLTDLYLRNSCTFDYSVNAPNTYLHIPYGYNRSNYRGFKRVLVGNEQSYYPVPYKADWVIAGENEGDYFGISQINGYFYVIEVFTNRDSVKLPVSTPAAGGYYYYIRYMGYENYYPYGTFCKFAPNLKSVIIPENYYNINVNWANNPITDLYLQGKADVPSTYWTLPSAMNVYVEDKSFFDIYETNSYWKNANIFPYGWDFEWTTVNVGRKGEFAQTYIEMTDADWSLGRYVKITGTLNDTDLSNIKNLTKLRKLDLSEAEFTNLPSSNFLSGASYLREVILPETIVTIPSYAFSNSSKLRTVVAPGINRIESNAFYYCNSLSNLDISKVKYIGTYAFYNCNSFNPASFSDGLSFIGEYAFYNTNIKEIILPNTITEVRSSVFRTCSELTKVTIPSTVKTISDYAFSGCPKLNDISLPEGLTSIGYSAFTHCTSLSEIVIPSSLQTMGSSVFYNCSSLKSVKCKTIVPPKTGGSFTTGVDLNHCTLYIAPFAIDAYRAADDWKDFYIMKPLNEPVKNIYINRPMIFDLLSEDNAVLQDNPNMTLDYSTSTSNVGQLTASGDGTLSAGIFTIYHNFGSRTSSSITDYRTTLVNNAENMRADSVLCSINFDKNKWHFISFQYDVKMSDIFGVNNTDFVIRKYNGANRAKGESSISNWETIPSDGVLEAGKGYIIQAANNTKTEDGAYYYTAIVRFPSRNTVTKNKLFTSKNVIVPLEEYPAEFAHNRSWNLVGNPYPCYYNMHYLLDDFTTPIVLWRGTSYQAYSPIDDDIVLRPNESFFVQRPVDAEQMVFSTEGRMHYSEAYNAKYNNTLTPSAYAPARRVSDNQRNVFNFNIEGCNNSDRARIVMNEEASMDYEINRDASKFFAEVSQGVEIYVDGDVKYDICERPFASGIATLGTRIATAGVYTISLNGRNMEGWSVILTDTKTGTITDLTKSAYQFNAEAGTESGRFLITFKAPGQAAVDEISSKNNDGAVRIVNVSGSTIYEGNLDDFMNSAPAGVYIVVRDGKTFKVMIK